MLSDDEFRILLKFLDRPWAGYRKVRKGVKKRVRRHMEKLGCASVEKYLQLLEHQPREKESCEQCLVVTISRFFRDRMLWRELRTRFLPELIKAFDAPIRIWSAGCACGEEMYTMAIVWDLLGCADTPDLLATDIRADCLEHAQRAVYGRGSLKEVRDDLRADYFEPLKNRSRFRVKQQALPPILWQQRDLFDPPPPGRFHMILLRNNLLTYHRGPRLSAAFERIVSTLTPGGYLVVGSHEKLPNTSCPLIRDLSCPWVYRLSIDSERGLSL